MLVTKSFIAPTGPLSLLNIIEEYKVVLVVCLVLNPASVVT